MTTINHYVINIELALKQRGHILDLGAVPSGSTINTGMRLTVCRDSYKNGLRAEDDDTGSNPVLCVFDGVEIGSTGVNIEWSLPDDLVSVN